MAARDFARSTAFPAANLPSARTSRGTLPVTTARGWPDPLIRVLALDRLRELHDDGVTIEYIGRMYGVTGERIRAVEDELRR